MAGSKKFKELLQPGMIGVVPTRNRMLKMAAHPGFEPYEEGRVQQSVIDYYEALAKGGAGVVTAGGAPIDAPPGRGFRVDGEEFLPSLTRLAQAIKAQGCPAFIQMFHIGAMRGLFPELGEPRAASTLSREELPTKECSPTQAVTIEEIKGIVDRFGSDAEYIKRAGFDGVEINAGCTHFLNSFMSRAWNKRTDEYGGSVENRARIVVEIMQEIKRRNGKDFAIVLLYNVAEPGLENGLTGPEAIEFAKIFEAGGADALHARIEFYTKRKDSGRNDTTHFPDVAFYPEPPAYATKDVVDTSRHGVGGWVPLAIEIKKVVKIPVITTGRLDPEIGQKLIKSGAVDFINLNRRLMADHDLPNKVIEDRTEDINCCTACMTCFSNMQEGKPPKCRVNAAIGKEREYEIKPAAKAKKVVVIGGGPAGMEFARVAALRGHKVTLFEKEPMLGGSVNMAAVVKGTEREDNLGFVDYLKRQIAKVGVDIKLGKEASKENVAELKPDVVVVAVGANHDIPNIPGINGKNVMTSETLHHQLKSYLKLTGARLMTKLVTKYLPVGKSVVVIGGNIQGCQTAEFLVKRGRKVAVVESGDEIGVGLLPSLMKPQLLDWLNKKDVPMLAGVKLEEVTDKGLVITTKEGQRQTLEADTILTTLPMLPNTALKDSLEGVAPEVYAIGDCAEPNLIVDAVAAGSKLAREI